MASIEASLTKKRARRDVEDSTDDKRDKENGYEKLVRRLEMVCKIFQCCNFFT